MCVCVHVNVQQRFIQKETFPGFHSKFRRTFLWWVTWTLIQCTVIRNTVTEAYVSNGWCLTTEVWIPFWRGINQVFILTLPLFYPHQSFPDRLSGCVRRNHHISASKHVLQIRRVTCVHFNVIQLWPVLESNEDLSTGNTLRLCVAALCTACASPTISSYTFPFSLDKSCCTRYAGA